VSASRRWPTFSASRGAIGGSGQPATTGTGSTSRSAVTTAQPAAATEPATTEPAAPSASSYGVRVKTLSKQCFGSAGCNVDVRLALSLESADAEGVAADVTVKVTGDESGATIETISVDEDGKYEAPELNLSTRSNATKVKATITDVETI
jgi:hypothetical protein